MKNIALILFGWFLGVATITVLGLLYHESKKGMDKTEEGMVGLQLFQEIGEEIQTKDNKIEVIQVISSNSALARIYQEEYSSVIILLMNYEGKTYYDDQTIKLTQTECLRQLGTYSYTTREGFGKTVPVVVVDIRK